jgi:hypothetical protein
MFREDFILRHIRLFVQLLAQLLGLIEAGDLTTSRELIQTAFRDYLGIDMEALFTVPEDKMIDYLTFGEQGENALDRCLFAVTLLFHLGEIEEGSGQPESAARNRNMAVSLMLETLLTLQSGYALPSFSPQLGEVLSRVTFAELSMNAQVALVVYYEQEGRLNDAAERLKELESLHPADDDIAALAASFHAMVADMTTAEKSAAGLVPSGQVSVSQSARPDDV